MQIYITNVFVDDQDKALEFYTQILQFQLKDNVPIGEFRWLTLVSPDDPDGTQLLLEPSNHPAVPNYKQALKQDGIPAHSFAVADIEAEYQRLNEVGVTFTTPVTTVGEIKLAVFDDTCGNLIQIVEKSML